MLPIGGLVMAVLGGWYVNRSLLQQAVGFQTQTAFTLWLLILRFVTPVMVGVIFVGGLL